MKYIHVDNPEQVINQLPLNWRNVSNLRGLEQSDPLRLLALGWRPVTEVNADYDNLYQVRTGPVVTYDATSAIATYTVNWKTTKADAIRAAKDRKQNEIRQTAQSIIVAKWAQWEVNNFARGFDPENAALYDADVALIRSESGNANPGTESGFEGAVEALTTLDQINSYTYTFSVI